MRLPRIRWWLWLMLHPSKAGEIASKLLHFDTMGKMLIESDAAHDPESSRPAGDIIRFRQQAIERNRKRNQHA